MINQEKKSSGPIVVGGAVYMGKADQAKPTPRPYVEYGKEQVFCHKYMLALAKRLDCDVLDVPGMLKWYAKKSKPDCVDTTQQYGWDMTRAALAAGGEDD